jgi:hypothetical protein
MTFRPAAQRNIASLFAHLGEQASYVPLGSGPVAVQVIRRQPDAMMDVGASRIHTTTEMFQVQVAQVSRPKAGDVIQIGIESFIVQGEPQREQHGLVWKLEAYPDAS